MPSPGPIDQERSSVLDRGYAGCGLPRTRLLQAWESGLYQRGDLRPLLPRVECPTLVVCGALDLIGCSSAVVPRVAGAELLVLPDCGHMPALEQPQSYRDAVLKWYVAHPAKL